MYIYVCVSMYYCIIMCAHTHGLMYISVCATGHLLPQLVPEPAREVPGGLLQPRPCHAPAGSVLQSTSCPVLAL